MNKKFNGPAAEFNHNKHIIKNINHEFQTVSTRSQILADKLTAFVGSWGFIIFQSVVIIIWLLFNSYLLTRNLEFFHSWDPYPFIFLNLIMSFQSAYAGPIVMMSQNRQAEKDRIMTEHDFQINQKSEEEIKIIMKHLLYQDTLILEILEKLKKDLGT